MAGIEDLRQQETIEPQVDRSGAVTCTPLARALFGGEAGSCGIAAGTDAGELARNLTGGTCAEAGLCILAVKTVARSVYQGLVTPQDQEQSI